MKKTVLVLTIIAGFAGWSAWLLLPTHAGLAFTLLLVGLTADLFDGFLARRWKVGSKLGAWLDTVADVPLYLLFPLQFWVHTVQLPLWVAIVVFFAGLFRLVRFSIRGLVNSNGNLAYAGLPVYYLQIFLALTLAFALPSVVLSIILVGISLLMVSKIPIPKTSVRTFIISLGVYVVLILWHFHGK